MIEPKKKSWTKTLLIYALGGGWGHLNRILALARIAVLSYTVKIITNSSYLQYLDQRELDFSIQIFFLSSQLDKNKTCQQIEHILLTESYDCLIIDTFPRGLGGELLTIIPQIAVAKILIHRDLNYDYIKAYNLENFVAHNFDLVLIPENRKDLPFAHLSQSYLTQPWLIRNADELPSLTKSRTLLKLKQTEQKIILVLSSGKSNELSFYGKATDLLSKEFNDSNLVIRCLSPTLPENCPQDAWVFHYPAIDCLSAATLVIGSGGYNTVYECQALDIPLIAIPFARLYDQQKLRIIRLMKTNQITLATSFQDIITNVKLYLSKNHYSLKPSYINGVEAAIQQIDKLLNA